jgi:fatty-acyl-CoA synthase
MILFKHEVNIDNCIIDNDKKDNHNVNCFFQQKCSGNCLRILQLPKILLLAKKGEREKGQRRNEIVRSSCTEKSVNATQESAPHSLLQPVHDMVLTDPEREAMVFGQHRLSYRLMAEYAAVLARHLLKSGVGLGDRVAVMSSPRPEAVISLLSVWLIGATWVGINPRYHKDEQRHVLIDSDAVALISITSDGKKDLEPDLASHEAETGIPVIRFGKTFWSRDLPAVDARLGLEDLWEQGLANVRGDLPAVVIYTSGSAGRPKGALITHNGLTFRSWTMFKDRFPVPRIRQLVDLPVNHIGAMASGIGLAMVAGGTLVFSEHFDPEMTLKSIASERLDVLTGVPTMISRIVGHPAFRTTDLSSIRYVSWGAGPIKESDLLALLSATRAEFSQQYGMTETNGPICYTPPTRDPDVLLQTTGKPDPRLELRIAGEGDQPVPVGTEGEVQVRMPYPFAGYLNNPDATKAAFTSDGFLHTGDLALVREDGYLVFCGRSKEMYKSGGFNVYPREVEVILEAHPSIKAAAVIGISDPTWGEVGYAFVELRHPVSPEDMLQWCKDRLANYKVPKGISVIDAIPRISVDKVDRSRLADLLAKKPGG